MKKKTCAVLAAILTFGFIIASCDNSVAGMDPVDSPAALSAADFERPERIPVPIDIIPMEQRRVAKTLQGYYYSDTDFSVGKTIYEFQILERSFIITRFDLPYKSKVLNLKEYLKENGSDFYTSEWYDAHANDNDQVWSEEGDIPTIKHVDTPVLLFFKYNSTNEEFEQGLTHYMICTGAIDPNFWKYPEKLDLLWDDLRGYYYTDTEFSDGKTIYEYQIFDDNYVINKIDLPYHQTQIESGSIHHLKDKLEQNGQSVIGFTKLGVTDKDTANGTVPYLIKKGELSSNVWKYPNKLNLVRPMPPPKTIKVKFVVKNGGYGLSWSHGIVSTQDDSFLVKDFDVFASDFYITITIPADNQYVNIRWLADTGKNTYLKAKMAVGGGGNYEITLDYNGEGKVATKNLYDVVCGVDKTFRDDFDNASNRAIYDKD